jgi:hypothetical protein
VALPLIASPALMVRTQALFDEGRFVATWVITGTSNDPALTPYLLLAEGEAEDGFQIKPVRNRDTVVRSFLPYLDVGLPVSETEPFELPVEAFLVLAALGDLYRRARFSAGLDHTAAPGRFTSRDLELALADGRQHPDPRWMLPFLRGIWPELPAGEDLGRGLQALANDGWVHQRDGEVVLSEQGLRLARSLDQRLAMLSFWAVGATPEGELAARSALFVRSPWHIWCFDVGGEDGRRAIGASVGLASTYALLQDLLTPVGTPLPVDEPQPQIPAVSAEWAVGPAQAAPPAPAASPVPPPRGEETLTGLDAVGQAPPAALVVREGAQPGQTFSLQGPATLGRSPENQIRLDDERASRRHARISPRGSHWIIEDLESRNGTFVNGQRVDGATPLRPGDQIRIGATLLQLMEPARKAAPSAASAACPHCGQPVRPGVRFCRYCGQPLSTQ